MSGLIAAGITAAGGVLSSGINAAMQKRANASNKQMADEAYYRQLEAIKQQNAYNSPANQVVRMKAAGLNPSLAYGADGAMVGEQSSLPEYSPIPSESPRLGDMAQQFASAVSAGISVRQQETYDRLAESEIASNDANAFLAYLNGERTAADLEFFYDTWDYRIEEYDLRNEETFRNIQSIIQNIAESKSRISVNEEQVKNLASLTSLNDAEVKRIFEMLPHEIANMDADTALKWMQTREGAERIKLIAAETLLTRQNLDIGWMHAINEGRSVDVSEASLELQRDWREHEKAIDWVNTGVGIVKDITQTVIGLTLMRGLGTNSLPSVLAGAGAGYGSGRVGRGYQPRVYPPKKQFTPANGKFKYRGKK